MTRHAGCRQIAQSLDDLVHGSLSAPETHRLNEHAAGCARCAQVIRRRSALVRSLTPPPEIELPSGFRRALVDRLLADDGANAERAPRQVALAPSRRPGLLDRLLEGWRGVSFAPAFRPVATFVAVCVVAVVLAYMAAQVVGTRRGRPGVAPVVSVTSPARAPAAVLSPARAHAAAPTSGASAVARAERTPSTGVAQAPASQAPAPPATEVAARPSAQPGVSPLAPVTPAAHDVVPPAGLDVVAAFEGVDPSRVLVRVDGADVTTTAHITPDYMVYSPAADLAAGRHVVNVEVRDQAGARRDLEWEFFVLGS